MQVLRHFLAAGVLLCCASCYTIQQVPEPVEFIREERPREVYVTFKNQSKVTLVQPRVKGDSIVGRVAGVAESVAAPWSHVDQVEARQRNQKRTRWMIAGLTVFTGFTVFMWTQAGGGNGVGPCDLATDECNPNEAP
jgi:hypothetical protein